MVFNGALMAAVATTSARLWQRVSCNPERFSSDQVLDLVFCFPLQQLGRLALCLWSFFCFPGPTLYHSSSSSSSSSSSDDDDDRRFHYHTD